MDSNITSRSWTSLIGESWEDNYKRLLEINTEFNGISNIGIYLPYIVGKGPGHQLVFTKASNNDKIAVLHIMKLSICEEYNKKVCSIELTFPGEIYPQKINREPAFFYRWYGKNVSIKKLIATFSVDEIRRHAESLLLECQRFNFMYCK